MHSKVQHLACYIQYDNFHKKYVINEHDDRQFVSVQSNQSGRGRSFNI
jgi:hypothetical protein